MKTDLVTRIEVIGPDEDPDNVNRRQLVIYGASNVSVELQDDGKTLKVFFDHVDQ